MMIQQGHIQQRQFHTFSTQAGCAMQTLRVHWARHAKSLPTKSVKAAEGQATGPACPLQVNAARAAVLLSMLTQCCSTVVTELMYTHKHNGHTSTMDKAQHAYRQPQKRVKAAVTLLSAHPKPQCLTGQCHDTTNSSTAESSLSAAVQNKNA
jgi:hypothetical protein